LKVLGEPFEQNIWIAFGLATFFFTTYLLLENRVRILENVERKKKRTVSQILFDVYAIVLQSETNKAIGTTAFFFNMCFLLKFLYTCIMTEEIIVPPSPHIYSTLTELFSEKYKLLSPHIIRAIENYPNVVQALRQTTGQSLEVALKSEGFSENLYSNKYWTEPLWQKNNSKWTDYVKAESKSKESSEVVKWKVIPSLRGNQAGLEEKQSQTQKQRKNRCHRAKKSYNGQRDFVWLEYSSISSDIRRGLG